MTAVVHRIKVEPLSSALDQSMEYNELYVPSSHVQSKHMIMSWMIGYLYDSWGAEL